MPVSQLLEEEREFEVIVRDLLPFRALIKRWPVFRQLQGSDILREARTEWQRGSRKSHDLQLIVMGKTGFGKSSTLNRLIGAPLFETSDVEPCTRALQCVDFKLSSGCYLSFGDMPGIGETEEKDPAYLEMYQNFLSKASVVLYVLRADARDYAEDLKVFDHLLRNQAVPIVVGLNALDKLEGLNRSQPFPLSAEKREKLAIKVRQVAETFEVPQETVIPYSALTGEGHADLTAAIAKAFTR